MNIFHHGSANPPAAFPLPLPNVTRSGGRISISKPERTARFCSSIFALVQIAQFPLDRFQRGPLVECFGVNADNLAAFDIQQRIEQGIVNLGGPDLQKETAPTDGPTGTAPP